MPQPSQPDIPLATDGDANATRASADQGTKQRDRQDTLLLSDVPEAAALIPKAVEPAQKIMAGTPQSPSPQAAAPHFPSVDLSPLSQRYELLAEAGHGSMGNVYKARDRETGETVALKLLKPEIASDQGMMERFKKELLFARKITHKNVCRVHDFNRIGGIAYTSMEFVEGDSLRSVLNRFGGLPQRKALDMALQMCSALQEAHVQGIVHRDLKPENVMVDAQGNVKIMDFGIARSVDAMTRLTGSMVGTPAYMAPEQVAGKQVDFRSDIYSLGLILYEMFTGQPAFQAENAVAVALKQMREAPKPPHTIDASIPFGIERAIMKCLEKEPARRFQSAAQLGDALRASLAAAPGAAPMVAPPFTTGSASSRTNHSSDGSNLAPHPLYGASALSAQEPRRSSASGWILLILLLAGGAYGATRWGQIVQFGHEYAPVTVSAAKYYYAQAKSLIRGGRNSPQADAESDNTNGAQPDARNASGDAAPVNDAAAAQSESANAAGAAGSQPTAKSSEARHRGATSSDGNLAALAHDASSRKAISTAPSGSSAMQSSSAMAAPSTAATNSTAGAKETPAVQAAKAPPAAQRRADATLGDAGTLSAPPVNDRASRYLWIGRYESEDRAQEKAKKISDLGLPVSVIPWRRDGNSFFLVLSGPFGPERVGSVMEWLKEQGFFGIRVLKNPMRNGHLVEGVEQDPE